MHQVPCFLKLKLGFAQHGQMARDLGLRQLRTPNKSHTHSSPRVNNSANMRRRFRRQGFEQQIGVYHGRQYIRYNEYMQA